MKDCKNEKGGGVQTKLLAAILAMTMIVCASAVVVSSESDADYKIKPSHTHSGYAKSVGENGDYNTISAAIEAGVTEIYLISDVTDTDITITGDLTVYGYGYKLSGAGFIIGSLTKNITVKIYDLEMDGSKIELGYGFWSVDNVYEYFVDLTIDNCYIHDYNYKGMYLTNTETFTLKNTVIEDCATDKNDSGGYIHGDYAVDLNLIKVTGAKVTITNNTFIGKVGGISAIKVTQRGGDGAYENLNEDASIESMTISGNDFSGVSRNFTPSDIRIGSADDGNTAKSYTFGFDSTIVASGKTIVTIDTGDVDGKDVPLTFTLEGGSRLDIDGSTIGGDGTTGSVEITIDGDAGISGLLPGGNSITITSDSTVTVDEGDEFIIDGGATVGGTGTLVNNSKVRILGATASFAPGKYGGSGTIEYDSDVTGDVNLILVEDMSMKITASSDATYKIADGNGNTFIVSGSGTFTVAYNRINDTVYRFEIETTEFEGSITVGFDTSRQGYSILSVTAYYDDDGNRTTISADYDYNGNMSFGIKDDNSYYVAVTYRVEDIVEDETGIWDFPYFPNAGEDEYIPPTIIVNQSSGSSGSVAIVACAAAAAAAALMAVFLVVERRK